jgi:Mg2+/Co2+ transporter CorB
MSISGLFVAFSILLLIVLIGIVFDVVGVAVTSADEKPFHSMAARKVPGAQDSIKLLRNAERVSSICNDVVGDICGVISGSASATIAAHMSLRLGEDKHMIIGLVMSGLVAGLTVGGKALGKSYAIGSCTKIVTFAGKFIYFIHHPVKTFQKKNK